MGNGGGDLASGSITAVSQLMRRMKGSFFFEQNMKYTRVFFPPSKFVYMYLDTLVLKVNANWRLCFCWDVYAFTFIDQAEFCFFMYVEDTSLKAVSYIFI